MRHRSNKPKFKGGSDSTRSVIRKLLSNFFKEGHLTSTEKRIKILRSEAEILITKAKNGKESDKNYLLRKLGDQKTINIVTEQIAPVFKDRVGGFVRIIKLTQRKSDGARVARLEWTNPVVLSKDIEAKVKKEKSEEKKTSAIAKSKTKPVEAKSTAASKAKVKSKK